MGTSAVIEFSIIHMISLTFRRFSVELAEIHKMHAPKFQGRVFSEVAEAPQAATTQTHPAGRP